MTCIQDIVSQRFSLCRQITYKIDDLWCLNKPLERMLDNRIGAVAAQDHS